MRIAQLGTFDVENFGDLLFPSILRRRLEIAELELVPVSPVGGPGIWADGAASISFRELLARAESFDGIVVGGGNIIHCSPTQLDEYAVGGLTPLVAYADLWLGASVIANRLELPLCWNAPGVPIEQRPIATPFVAWALGRVDYLSVRDATSAAFLGHPHGMHVAIDTGLEIAGLWSAAELDRAYDAAFRQRGRTPPARTIAVHVNARYSGESIEETAHRVESIARALDAAPILLAIGPCHGDDALATAVGEALAIEHLVIEKPASLVEVAACIARSGAYVGSSLHGMITACAFGVRGLVVAPAHLPKFHGFLARLGLERRRVTSWAEAEQAAPSLRDDDAREVRASAERATHGLEEHWRFLRETLQRGRGARPSGAPPAWTLDDVLGAEGYRGLPYEEPVVAAGCLLLQERVRKLQASVEELRESKRKLETKARTGAAQLRAGGEQHRREVERERARWQGELLVAQLAHAEERAVRALADRSRLVAWGRSLAEELAGYAFWRAARPELEAATSALARAIARATDARAPEPAAADREPKSGAAETLDALRARFERTTQRADDLEAATRALADAMSDAVTVGRRILRARGFRLARGLRRMTLRASGTGGGDELLATAARLQAWQETTAQRVDGANGGASEASA